MQVAARRSAYFAAGLGLMALAWAKNRVSGYTTPSLVAHDDLPGAIAYVRDVVEDWLKYLPADSKLSGRDVLELCPGASLGTGALLLALGARSYHAIDKFALLRDPPGFYDSVLDGLDARFAPADIARARSVAASGGLSYRADFAFDIEALAEYRRFGLMTSYVALEHFEDIASAARAMANLAAPGCLALHMIDFRTHTRWIRDVDPNNIYRYPAALYRLFGFPGQHNRLRPDDYVEAFVRAGWRDVAVLPAEHVPEALRPHGLGGFTARFAQPEARMDMLAGVLVARWA